MRWLIACLIISLSAVFFCEYVADYLFLRKCAWPEIERKNYNEDPLRAMILSDPHIAGLRYNGLQNRVYNEWHMSRAFQASIRLFQPDVVFILGDLFDEGYKLNNEQFEDHEMRYIKTFKLPQGVPLISLAGNHDVGFHFRLSPFYFGRFEDHFKYSLVHLYTIKEIHFVLINSMVMEMDACFFCSAAESALKNISRTLKCMKYPEKKECSKTHRQLYSQPILLQHIPTYRVSDKTCIDHDAPHIYKYRENIDVLSKDSTDMLGVLFKPRLSFAGHSHHYCHSLNRLGIDEYTVASFCWRNKNNPSFLMATITPNDYKVAKCSILSQRFVYNCYYFVAALWLIAISYRGIKCVPKKRQLPRDEDLKKC